MRRITTNGKHNIYEIFDTFSEFLSTCDARDRNFGDARTRYAEDDGWAGANYDQAREMLTHGYEKSIKNVATRVNQLQKQSFVEKPCRVRDFVGFAPIVPNVVVGYPKTMWNNRKKPQQKKVITLLYDAGVTCDISKSQLEEHGAQVVNYVMNLERLGYRIRIDAMVGFTSEHTYALRVAVKHEDQPINLKRVSFPMTHVAFLRTLGFDWYERCPDAVQMGGYGTQFYHLSDSDRREKLAPIMGENEYYLNYASNPEDVFSEFADELKGAR